MVGNPQGNVLDLRGDIQLPLELSIGVKNLLASMASCVQKHFPYKKMGSVLWTLAENAENPSDPRIGWPAFLYTKDLQELIALGYLEVHEEEDTLYLTAEGQMEGERILTNLV